MQIKNRLIGILLVLSNLYSCSAQKDLQRERYILLQDVFKQENRMLHKSVLSKSEVEVRGDFKFKTSIYFNIDSLSYAYTDAPAYWLQIENFDDIKDLHSLLTQADLNYMKKQYENSNTLNSKEYFKGFPNDLKVMFIDRDRTEFPGVSLPLFSKDKKKCMFFYFLNISRQVRPNVWFCKKENGKWKLVARIEGSFYDFTPYH